MSQDDGVASVQVALTTVPTSVQCIRLTATPSSGSATNKTFPVTAGSASTNLQMGQLAPGNYTMSGDAFTVACASISGAAPWIADPVAITLRAGAASVLTMSFRRNGPITVNANFLNNVQSIAPSFQNAFVSTDSGVLQIGTISATQVFTRASFAVFDSSSTPTNAVAVIVASNNAVCAARLDGQVYCWGSSPSGEVGPGIAVGAFTATPVLVTGVGSITMLSAGLGHFCGTSGGNIWCWGRNDSGQLGNGTTTNSQNPVTVAISSIRSLSCGYSSSYAVTSSGQVYSWGNNGFGQLGDNTTLNRLTPVAALDNVAVQSVTGGGNHACGLRADGSVRCWGYNASGALGNGTTTNSSSPVLVSGLTARQIVASYGTTCALNTAGQTLCWGLNDHGGVGDSTGTNRSVPTAPSLGSVVLTSLWSDPTISSTCGIASNLDAYCWGQNNAATIGDGTFNDAFAPIRPLLQ